MDTAHKSICCKDIDKIDSLLVGDPPPTCITTHAEFSNACLSRTVLTIAWHGYRHNYGTRDVLCNDYVIIYCFVTCRLLI